MTDPRVRFLAGVDDADVAEVLQMLDGPTIRITARVTEWRHQVLLYALVDLLGRLFPRLDVAVDLDAPAADGLPPGGVTVGERIQAVRFRSPLEPLAPATPMLTVHVGPDETGADLYVDASEWQSYLGRRRSRLAPPRRDTAVGPLAAACRAAARVCSMLLASMLDQRSHADEVYSSALTYRTGADPIDDPEPVEVGRLDALLVGGGSLGGAAANTMAYEPDLTGELTTVDPQHLEDTNPYRAILATSAAAAEHAAKANEISDALVHHQGFTVHAHVMTVTEWEAAQPGPPRLPLVLVAVDTREARELIQDTLPLEVVNAAVGADLVALSGHRTGAGPCMCCLHMPEVLDAAAIKNRLIATATGITQPQVNELRVLRTPLDDRLLRQIERHRDLQPMALAVYVGATLDELYNAELLYGETKVQTSTGAFVAVAAPFVTALAGVLLAGEAFKRSTPAMHAYALGADGPATQYRENPYVPDHGYLDPHVARSAVCLCRSVRRLRVLADLHGLALDTLTT